MLHTWRTEATKVKKNEGTENAKRKMKGIENELGGNAKGQKLDTFLIK